MTSRPGARLLSFRQVEEEYGMPADSLAKLVKEGKLRVVEPPTLRRRFIDRQDLERCIEEWKS